MEEETEGLILVDFVSAHVTAITTFKATDTMKGLLNVREDECLYRRYTSASFDVKSDPCEVMPHVVALWTVGKAEQDWIREYIKEKMLAGSAYWPWCDTPLPSVDAFYIECQRAHVDTYMMYNGESMTPEGRIVAVRTVVNTPERVEYETCDNTMHVAPIYEQ